MDKPKTTAKDFVLWAGAMASLYGGVVAFISLVFSYINHAFPNPVTDQYYYYGASSADISYETASLIVLTPVFLILMRLIRRDIAKDPSKSEIWVRRWAIFLTLFIAGATMVVDLIIALNAFLQGEEMTIGFMLKVVTVLLVAGLGFLHFLADMRGYWEKEPARARLVNYGVGVLVVATIIAGFFIIGTPSEIRMEKQDAIRIQDLQNIQWQVVNFWQQKESLPKSLEELNDPISYNHIAVDPETGASYGYRATGALTFELCATFALAGDSQMGPDVRSVPLSPSIAPSLLKEDNWQHDAGEACFERSIDPERYPPYTRER